MLTLLTPTVTWAQLPAGAQHASHVEPHPLPARAADRTAPAADEAALKQQAREAYAHLPLSFIENQGQRDARVAYYTQQGGASVYFTAEEVVMALPDGVLRTRFVDANPDVRITGTQPQETTFNYFIGNDPDQWHSDIRAYGAITYHDLYPGIDLTYTGRNGALKYEFVLQPGADVNAIRMAYAGVDDVRLDENGDLLVTPEGGEIPLRDTAPTVYQEIDGVHVGVDAAFTISNDHNYGFSVGKYDPAYPLVIDPELSYSTFLGGSDDEDEINEDAIAVDSVGNVYVAGGTTSSDFPTTTGAYDRSHSAEYDVFVSVLDPTLSSLRYATLLGGVMGLWLGYCSGQHR